MKWDGLFIGWAVLGGFEVVSLLCHLGPAARGILGVAVVFTLFYILLEVTNARR
jgi:hypothetical protein